MKPQDIFFFVILLVFLFLKRKPTLFIFAGIFCLFASVLFFALHIFFTAERIVWYAGGFLLIGVVLSYLKNNNSS